MYRDAHSVVLLAQPFGYGSAGHLTVTLQKLVLYRRHDQQDKEFSLKNLGIILSSAASQPKFQEYLNTHKCPLQDQELSILTFDSPEVQKLLSGEAETAKLDVDVEAGGLASLYFINCEAGMPASFGIKIEQYNLVGAGRKDYLSAGDTQLDIMYWVS